MDTKEINKRLVLLGSYAMPPIVVNEIKHSDGDGLRSEYFGDGPVWQVFTQGGLMGSLQVVEGEVHYYPSMKDSWRYDYETLGVLHLMVSTIRENL